MKLLLALCFFLLFYSDISAYEIASSWVNLDYIASYACNWIELDNGLKGDLGITVWQRIFLS